MPKTRNSLDRIEKRNQILDQAELLVGEGGYGAMSVSAIAKHLRLAPNAVYWYFPSKDHLFVAVLQRMTERSLRTAEPMQREGVPEQILWAVARLDEIQPLCADIHDRARLSSLVAAFHESFHQMVRSLLVGLLSGHVSTQNVEVAADALITLIEGTFLHDLAADERARIIRFVLDRAMAQRRSPKPD